MLKDNLHMLRVGRNMTLDQVALKAGTSKSYIWELENNSSSKPSASLVLSLAKIFGTTVEDLLGKEQDEHDVAFIQEFKLLEKPLKKKLLDIMRSLKENKREPA